MQPTLRTVVVSVAVGTLCALTAALAVLAIGSRPTILLTSPSATSGGTLDAGVISSGDASNARKKISFPRNSYTSFALHPINASICARGKSGQFRRNTISTLLE